MASTLDRLRTRANQYAIHFGIALCAIWLCPSAQAQSVPGAASPGESPDLAWSSYALSPDTVFSRVEVNSSGRVTQGTTAGGAAERLGYGNTIGLAALEFPANQPVSDDIVLTTTGDCGLRRYMFRVTGKANPAACGGIAESCGPFSVTFGLYDECPGAGGELIPGTGGSVNFADDGEYEITFVIPAETEILVPNRVWLATTFDRAAAGTVFAGPALHGFSQNVVDTLGFPCNSIIGAYPDRAYAAFAADVYVDAACPEGHPTYLNSRSANSGVTAGNDTCIAEDITLNRTCNMVALEIGVRGLGRYDFELRQPTSAGEPDGFCNAFDAFGVNAVEGTRLAFANPTNDFLSFRKTFDPPIPLPHENLFAVMMGSGSNATWVLTRHDADVGSTLRTYYTFDDTANEGTWLLLTRPDNAHAGFQLAITCEGAAPSGACCDQFNLNETGETVCRDVPEINCSVTYGEPDHQPAWVEGLNCVDEPFPHPCGQSACCTPEDRCENLTTEECDALPPTENIRTWTVGAYCETLTEPCSPNACLQWATNDDCETEHDSLGCQNSYCCDEVCVQDRWCCQKQWDQICVRTVAADCGLPGTATASDDMASDHLIEDDDANLEHREELDDPPYRPSRTRTQGGVGGTAQVERNGYVSLQVNTDQFGDNIPGDAANEPSIAVDPNDPQRMVIGWRQFDSIQSNFRQAGVAYSSDAGATWNPDVLTPGVFRSDPVVVADADGYFHYLSLAVHRECRIHCELFTSMDGGMTWGEPVYAFGGDKAWITADATGSPGRNNLYQTWTQTAACEPGSFNRSTDRGASFENPLFSLPRWGTLTVDLNGILYVAGEDDVIGVRRSVNALDADAQSVFEPFIPINLGGELRSWSTPNPMGLAGQVWIRSDRGVGTNAGDLYVLASVGDDLSNTLDVMFSRSEDGGQTWSAAVRVNDDPVDSGAYQWFGTMDVAPNGRIDAVWNDTRNTGEGRLSELYYAFSTDGGRTWSKNIPVSPVFDSHVGWPNQNKIGDYYDMVSDNAGANVAYAATFNGEQDVYFLRIRPNDCNDNGLPDDEDIAEGRSADCNGDEFPDECDTDCNQNGIADVCELLNGAANCDNDRLLDVCQPDLDGDGLIDPCDPDPDNDGVLDELGICRFTPPIPGALPDGRPRPDTTGDCEIDLRDYWRFLNCFTGGLTELPPPVDACLERFDADDNLQFDLRDVGVFQNAFTTIGN